MHQLPLPHSSAIAHSQQLTAQIIQKIAAHHNQIPFADFMHMALYAPGLGYYHVGNQKLGQYGDFITAPEISPLFSYSLAYYLNTLYTHISASLGAYILEVGAGSGKMALHLLQYLQQQNSLPEKYYILELSPDLQQKQQHLLQQKLPDIYPRIVWLDTLPQNFKGIILANEVLDAMPVHLLSWQANQLQEKYVSYHHPKQSFYFTDGELSHPLLSQKGEYIASLQHHTSPYITEVNLLAESWLASIADCLEAGVCIVIDYGFPEQEYYHPDRNTGTLMCHYQHHSHTDPFFYPGLQDITAHVNFTALANTAVQHAMQVNAFTTQAYFLLGNHLVEFAQQQIATSPSSNIYPISQAVRTLTLAEEMGELFKVLVLSKNITMPAPHFTDLRQHL